MYKILIPITLLLLTGCESRFNKCVELVATGEYALTIEPGVVRVVETKKLVKARHFRDDYIFVDQRKCEEYQ